jgi:Phosphoesterase family
MASRSKTQQTKTQQENPFFLNRQIYRPMHFAAFNCTAFISALVFFFTSLVSNLSFAITANEARILSASASVKKIMVVVLENESDSQSAKQPFLKSLLQMGASLENMTSEAKPSQPNYIALTAGSTYGINTNDPVTLDSTHIGDLLEANGRNWKTYAENFPGNCFLGASQNHPTGQFVRKHVPFLSFRNVTSNPARCSRIVEAAQMDVDIKNGTLPDFSLYVPNQNNNGHDTNVKFADTWLKNRFENLLKDQSFMKDMLFIVTFDEGRGQQGNIYLYRGTFGEARRGLARREQSLLALEAD